MEFPIHHDQFSEGVISDVNVVPLERRRDHRGWLMELFRNDEIEQALPAMAYVSESDSAVVRGPHMHWKQTDHFVVIGPGDFEFCCWDDRPESPSAGVRQIIAAGESHPKRISIPPLIVHAYKNVSGAAAWLFNFPDQLYAGNGRNQVVDEVRYEDCPDHPFHW